VSSGGHACSAELKAARLQYRQSALSQVVPCSKINISWARLVKELPSIHASWFIFKNSFQKKKIKSKRIYYNISGELPFPTPGQGT